MNKPSPPVVPRAREDAAAEQPLLTLTPEEIFEITGYRRAHEQLKWFKALGVPARRRADGTVSVAREHYLRAGTASPAGAVVESRPRLRSERLSDAP